MDLFKVAVIENQEDIITLIDQKHIEGERAISATKFDISSDRITSITNDSFDLLLMDGSFETDFLTAIIKKMEVDCNLSAVPVFVYGINPNLDQLYLQYGVKGLLFEGFSGNEMVSGISACAEKGFFFPDATTKKMVHSILTQNDVIPRGVLKQLTGRELEIIRMVCDGFTNKEIALELDISIRTVEVHRKNIGKKTFTKNTAGIVVFAIRNGLYKV